MPAKKNFGLILALLSGLFLIPLSSQAFIVTWNGGDGNWINAANWTPTGIPNSSGAEVWIDGSQTGINSTVTYDGSGPGGVVVGTLTVDAGDTLALYYPLGLGQTPGGTSTVTNNGTIALISGGLSSQQSTINLTGTGSIVMAPDKRNVLTNGGWGGTFVNQAPHIIRGAGEIDFWLTNQSQIIAENGTFYIGATITNTDSGTLEVNGPGNAFHLNGAVTGGGILPGLGQVILDRIQLSNLTLGPGAVTMDPHSEIFNQVRAGVTFSAGTEVTVPAGVALNLGTAVSPTDPVVTIVNHGVIRLTGGGAQLNSKNAKLSGTGRVVLGGDLNNAFTGTDFLTPSYFTLENDAGHTIEGGGSIACKSITNNGAITANNGPLRIYAANNGAEENITGAGTITVAANASFEAGGPLWYGNGGVGISCLTTNHGTLAANNGTLRLYASVLGGGQITVADNCSLELYNQAQAGNLSLSPLASLSVQGSMGQNHGFALLGNFTFAQTDPNRWNWAPYTGLAMLGNGDWQSVEVGGQDLGPVAAGFTKNFALPALEVVYWGTAGARAYLADQVDNGHRAGKPEALYANYLWVDPDTTLNLNNLRLYTYLEDGSIHRVRAGEGNLFGGGQIIDVSVSPGPRSLPGILLPLLE